MTDRIEDYLRRLRPALRALPDAEREDILAETRSHLAERRESGGEAAVQQAIAAFGHAEDYARAFVEDSRLRAATAGGGPLELASVLLGQATRSLPAFFGFALAAWAYLFGVLFFIIAGAELVRPDLTGLWIGPDDFFLGIYAGDGPGPDTRDVLGAWLIPVMVLAGSIALAAGVAISRAAVRFLLRKR